MNDTVVPSEKKKNGRWGILSVLTGLTATLIQVSMMVANNSEHFSILRVTACLGLFLGVSGILQRFESKTQSIKNKLISAIGVVLSLGAGFGYSGLLIYDLFD